VVIRYNFTLVLEANSLWLLYCVWRHRDVTFVDKHVVHFYASC